MEVDPEEPMLPYTPSNTGRRAKVGYLGFDGVGFNELWPLFAGLVASIGLALRFFLAEGADGSHWLARTVVACLPFAAGFGYLRFAVEGRPPHFKGDLWETILCLRIDFTDPPIRAVPLWPRVAVDSTSVAGPGRAADLGHPMHAAAPGRSRA
jgi:hypothetical protein